MALSLLAQHVNSGTVFGTAENPKYRFKVLLHKENLVEVYP